jgi:hypothetical protein
MQLLNSGQLSVQTINITRQVLLIWPSSMRIGEREEISLVFEPSEAETPLISQQVETSDVYNHYNLMAEARFEVAGITVSPANPIRESMPAGVPVKFKWQISTDQAGSYDGTMWLSLRFLPLDGSQAIQIPIYIRDMTIRTSSLFGMNEAVAYYLGGAGMVLAGVLVFGDMMKWTRLWMRNRTFKGAKDT